ncbi:hypothetical protein SUGI_0498050 [Cryptomeria japonica]|nr:hypothetical protein SUGI_0498050 [Cryptomeria japonica]
MVERQFKVYVIDYVSCTNKEKLAFAWKPVELFVPQHLDARIFKEALYRRTIVLSQVEDKVVWCLASSREYNVRERYELLRRNIGYSQWLSTLRWHKSIAPRVRTFLWVTLHGRILTSDLMKSIAIFGPSICPMCFKDEETLNLYFFGDPLLPLVGIGLWNPSVEKLQDKKVCLVL